MSKYPFGAMSVGESRTIEPATPNSCRVALSQWRDQLKRDGWQADELPSFVVRQHGRGVLLTRLPDGVKPPRGPTATSRRPAPLTPIQYRCRTGFSAFEDAWHAARERGESLLPSRDLLDLLLAHAPDLHSEAIRMSMTPLVFDDLDNDPHQLDQNARDATVQARLAIRRGDNPHDEAFLMSLRRATRDERRAKRSATKPDESDIT